jgi:hypothetical protein
MLSTVTLEVAQDRSIGTDGSAFSVEEFSAIRCEPESDISFRSLIIFFIIKIKKKRTQGKKKRRNKAFKGRNTLQSSEAHPQIPFEVYRLYPVHHKP